MSGLTSFPLSSSSAGMQQVIDLLNPHLINLLLLTAKNEDADPKVSFATPKNSWSISVKHLRDLDSDHPSWHLAGTGELESPAISSSVFSSMCSWCESEGFAAQAKYF